MNDRDPGACIRRTLLTPTRKDMHQVAIQRTIFQSNRATFAAGSRQRHGGLNPGYSPSFLTGLSSLHHVFFLCTWSKFTLERGSCRFDINHYTPNSIVLIYQPLISFFRNIQPAPLPSPRVSPNRVGKRAKEYTIKRRSGIFTSQ